MMQQLWAFILKKWKLCSHRNSYLFIAALFIITKSRSKLNHLQSECLDWSIHAMEYYIIMTRNGLLICAATWINLQGIMLSDKSQSQKVTYCVIPFRFHYWNYKITAMESILVVTSCYGWGWKVGMIVKE